MKTSADFATFYRSELVPHLEPLEQRRKEAIGRIARVSMAVPAAAILLAFVVAQLWPGTNLWIFPPFLGLFVWFLLAGLTARGYNRDFKERIISRIIQFVDPNLQYRQGGYIPESVFISSQMFLANPDRYSGEDLVWGQIGQTAIQFSEVRADECVETTNSKGEREEDWKPIFHGVFFIADFNKHFQGVTVVVPDMGSAFGRVGRWVQSLAYYGAGKLTQLEDPVFERRFEVYASNDIEARYLLSPKLMARIVDFGNRTGHQISLSFVNANLHVAIRHSKNLFEPRLYRTVLDEEMAREYLEDLLLVVGIVEDLDLNTRIWSKPTMA